MFGLTEWQQTRFYQEVEQEVEQKTKLKAIYRMLNMGFSIEQIALALELKVEVVREAVEKKGGEES